MLGPVHEKTRRMLANLLAMASDNDNEAGIALNKLRKRAKADGITGGALKAAMEDLRNAPSGLGVELRRTRERLTAKENDLRRVTERLTAKEDEIRRTKAGPIIKEDELRRTVDRLIAKEAELRRVDRAHSE